MFGEEHPWFVSLPIPADMGRVLLTVFVTFSVSLSVVRVSVDQMIVSLLKQSN